MLFERDGGAKIGRHGVAFGGDAGGLAALQIKVEGAGGEDRGDDEGGDEVQVSGSRFIRRGHLAPQRWLERARPAEDQSGMRKSSIRFFASKPALFQQSIVFHAFGCFHPKAS
jgi:hypothetical protein